MEVAFLKENFLPNEFDRWLLKLNHSPIQAFLASFTLVDLHEIEFCVRHSSGNVRMHGQMKGVGAIGARRFTTPVDHRRGTTGAGIERTGSRFGVYRETLHVERERDPVARYTCRRGQVAERFCPGIGNRSRAVRA